MYHYTNQLNSLKSFSIKKSNKIKKTFKIISKNYHFTIQYKGQNLHKNPNLSQIPIRIIKLNIQTTFIIKAKLQPTCRQAQKHYHTGHSPCKRTGRQSIGASGKKITSQPIASYRQRLLREDDSQLDIYDPFQTPPNFTKAQRHHSGMSIGIPILQTGAIKDIQVCPCCQNPINKQPIPICCNDQQLLFLGVGYPLYFKLAKYITVMILLVFLISGSGLSYLLRVQCNDSNKCLSFFGFTIVDFEIQESQKGTVEMMNMATAILIFAVVIYIKSLINNDITSLQSKVVCPSQYTIMLQNLPKTFQQFELKKWIKQTFSHDTISINLCYNIQHLQSAYQHRNNLTIQLRHLQIKHLLTLKTQLNLSSHFKLSSPYLHDYQTSQPQRQKQLLQQIQKYDKIIHDYRNNIIDGQKNGTAFVMFESAQTPVEILEKYQKMEIVSFVERLMGMVMAKGNGLRFKNRVIKVSRAPAPRQVIWQHLQYSHFRSFTFQLLFIFSMLFLIYFAFKYQYLFSSYAYQLRKQTHQSPTTLLLFQALIASLIVILVNSLLRITILIFTKLKRYHSHTSQQSSFCFYYTLSYVFNSCFMIYIIHGQCPQESSQLLLYDIHLIMLANAFSQPLYKLLDPIMWHKIIWKRYLKSLPPEKNPYTQMYVNKYFQGHQISNGDNYQYISRILIISYWFAHAAPLGVLFCLIGMGVDYFIGKVLLLRVYKKPQNISKSIATVIVNTFELLPLVYICGVLQFTYKSTSSQASILQFLLNFFNYSITITILIICLLTYLLFFKTTTTVIPSTPYSQIKSCFGFNYQTQNPITKFRGEINYLQNIIKSLKGGAWMNVHSKQDLTMISELGRCVGEPQGIDKVRVSLAKIKIRMENSRQFQDSDDDEMIELKDLSDKNKRSNELRYSLSSKSQIQDSPINVSDSGKKKKQKVFFKRTRSIMQ